MTLPRDVQENVGWLDKRGRDDAWSSVRAHLMSQEAEIERLARDNERLDASESQLIGERDRAQDALQKTHIELGGDGEWTCKMGAAADYPPNSGDLHDDVPVLAAEVLARSELAKSRLAAANALLRSSALFLQDMHILPPEETCDASVQLLARIQAHLSEPRT